MDANSIGIIIGAAAGSFAAQFWGNKKVDTSTKGKADAEQVEELKGQVEELQIQVTALNVKVSKVIPRDDRKPG